MSDFVTHDHFDVNFFRERDVAFEFFDDDPGGAYYVFHPTTAQIDEWRAAKARYTEAVASEMLGGTSREIYDALHRPMRRTDE